MIYETWYTDKNNFDTKEPVRYFGLQIDKLQGDSDDWWEENVEFWWSRDRGVFGINGKEKENPNVRDYIYCKYLIEKKTNET